MNSKKTIMMLACIGNMLTLGGNNLENQTTHNKATPQPEMLTLIGKKMIYCDHQDNDRASLFFDTDKNTNTTEIVLHTRMHTSKTEAAVFDAKIGETKTKKEWVQQIPTSPLSNNFFSVWSYVR